MLQEMSNTLVKHSKILFGAITIIIIVSFVWFLTPGASGNLFFQGHANKMGSVMGEDIMVKDVQAMVDVVRLVSYPEVYAYSKERAKDFRPDFDEERLFNMTAVIRAAEKLGVGVSDAEIQDVIKNLPAFQKDGKFSMELYEQFKKDVLEPNGYNFSQFENAIGKQILMDKFSQSIADGVSVTDGEVEDKAKELSLAVTVATYKFDAKAFTAGLGADAAEIKSEYEKNSKNYMSDPISDAWIAAISVKNIKEDAKKTEIIQKLGHAADTLKALKSVTKADVEKAAKEIGAKVSEVKGITDKSPATASMTRETIDAVCRLTKENSVGIYHAGDEVFAIAVLSKRIEAKLLPLDDALKTKITGVIINRKAAKAAAEAATQCRTGIVEKKLTGKAITDAVVAAKGTVGEKETKQRFEYLVSAKQTQMYLQMLLQQLQMRRQQSPELLAMLQSEQTNIVNMFWKGTGKVGDISGVNPQTASFMVIESISSAAELNADQKKMVREDLLQAKRQRADFSFGKWLEDNVVRLGKSEQQESK